MISPLLDDGAGRIARAAVAVSAFSAQHFPQAIRQVLSAIPAEIELDIVFDAPVRPQLGQWLDDAGRTNTINLHQAPEGLNYSLWLQDPLLIRADGSASASDAFARYQDREIALFLRNTLGWPQCEPGIDVDGGNVITHGDLVLVSADVDADEDALSAFDPSRRLISLGTAQPCVPETTRQTDRPQPGWTETLHQLSLEDTRQPVFHLDHMIAPAGHSAGKPRFLVGCPRLGASMIGHPLWDHAQPDAFDEIAAMLEASGAEVIRNPQPLAWVARPDRQLRRWFHLPVHHVLIPADAVLLPCFANEHWPELRPLDAANADIWAQLGFQVIPVPDMMAFAEARGGPRCMVKVTARR